MEITKKCSKCGETKPATKEYYYADKRAMDGLQSECKTCHKEANKQWHNGDVDYWKRYGQSHKEQKAEANKLYRAANAERIAKVVKKRHELKRDSDNDRIKRWAEKNKDYLAKYYKQYFNNNKEKVIITQQRRRSRKRNLPATLTAEQWERIKEYFNNRCAYCGVETKLTQDHVVSVASNGGYEVNNIVPACHHCNCSKSSTDYNSWYINQVCYTEERHNKIMQHIQAQL